MNAKAAFRVCVCVCVFACEKVTSLEQTALRSFWHHVAADQSPRAGELRSMLKNEREQRHQDGMGLPSRGRVSGTLMKWLSVATRICAHRTTWIGAESTGGALCIACAHKTG